MQLLIEEEFLPAAKYLIMRAKYSVFISTFKAEITSKPRGRKLSKLFDEICQAKIRGLDVRVLINTAAPRGSIPLSNAYAVTFLKKNGVEVRKLQHERCCHAKLIIVDGGTVILGSHNLSVKSCHNNFEVSCMIYSQPTVETLWEKYNEVWEGAKEL